MTKKSPAPAALATKPTNSEATIASSPDEKKTANGSSSSSSSSSSSISSTALKSSVPVSIRARNELDRKLLVAATEGDIAYLESVRIDPPRNNKGHGKSKNNDKNYTNDGTRILREAVCVSGCTLLHWAAGSNQVDVLEYLLSEPRSGEDDGGEHPTSVGAIFSDHESDNDGPSHLRAVDLPVTKCKKSLGRTPLHYACRNGCLEAVRWLVLVGRASVGVMAKQGVTPFQLAVWQNRLEICVFLTETAKTIQGISGGDNCCFDPAKDFNDFGCGAVHWLGIAPESRANCNRGSNEGGNSNDNDDENEHNDSWYNDGRDLLPLARWLATLPGIDFDARQRQNHTALHKASWGGHLALVDYLHEDHDMWDDIVDDAGNYAASLADMAHTPKHSKIADYLRRHCSRKRAESLLILGLKGREEDSTLGKDAIRKAYLAKARQLHPDRLVSMSSPAGNPSHGNANDALGEATEGEVATAARNNNEDENANAAPTTLVTFDALRKAYLHLTEEDGVGDQSNPAHSLNLMLRYVNNSGSNNNNTTDENEKNILQMETNNPDGEEDNSFFKARLVAVLLEYGDKGIDLSNVKKKWKQVWPEIPFPSQQQKACQSEQKQAKKIPMADFLLQKAGDVIRFERHGDRKRRVLVLLKNRNSSKESVLRSGSVATGAATVISEGREGRQ